MNIINKFLNSILPNQKVSKTMFLNTLKGSAHWPERDYNNFAKETYMKNVIAFRCMFKVGSNISRVPWKLYKQSANERIEVTGHPINQLLKRPNLEDSFNTLLMRAIVFYLISGNTYFERIRLNESQNNPYPKELHVLRPDKITIDTSEISGAIINYNYENGFLKFPVDPVTGFSDILHLKSFNPIDDFFGASITESTAREIDSSNEATEWQKKMFENEGRPGMTISIAGFLDDEQWDKLENQLRDKYSGSANAGKNLIIEGETAAQVKPYNWSPKEMDWIESNRELARKICLGYDVPPQLLGIPGDSTYNNYREARASFWEDTIIYYLDLFKGKLNRWIFNEEDQLFLDYDLDQIPALTYKREMLWKQANESNFVTINEKREMVGLEKIDGGDVLLVGMGMTPLDTLGMNDNNNREDDLDEEEKQILEAMKKNGYSDEEAKEFIGV